MCECAEKIIKTLWHVCVCVWVCGILFIYDYWQATKLIENSLLAICFGLDLPQNLANHIFMRLIVDAGCGAVNTQTNHIDYPTSNDAVSALPHITNYTTFITLSQVNRTSVKVCLIKRKHPLLVSSSGSSCSISLWPFLLPH